MAYPAAVFLLNMEKYQAFKYFTNLILSNEFIYNLFKFKLNYLDAYARTFEYFLREKLPKTVKHLEELKISTNYFLIEWFYTLFCRAFDLCTVGKIWDLFITYGEVILFKTAIAIFTIIEHEILDDKGFDETLFIIRNCTM